MSLLCRLQKTAATILLAFFLTDALSVSLSFFSSGASHMLALIKPAVAEQRTEGGLSSATKQDLGPSGQSPWGLNPANLSGP